MGWAEQAQQIVVDGNVMVALAVAALAGFVSFASPCVLPLVPGYLSYMSGVSGQDVEQRGDRRAGRVVAGAALFVLGFSIVFVALGAALGAVTSWLVLNRNLVTRVAGVLVIVYSLGLGLPFLVAALGFRRALGRFPALRARFRLFELVGGGMLVVIGVLLLTGLWDALLTQLKIWSGSITLPL